jgi:hypothetical protein
MCRKAIAIFHEMNPIVEKLEVLVRLSPVLESTEEQSWVLSTLLEICGDYTQRLREALNTLTHEEGSEHEPAQ